MIRAIIFDLDDTLVQSEKLKAQSYGIGAQRILGLPQPDPRALVRYDPDCDEGIWNYLKRVELKNLSCHNLSHLWQELRQAKERLRHKSHIIQACFKQHGLV